MAVPVPLPNVAQMAKASEVVTCFNLKPITTEYGGLIDKWEAVRGHGRGTTLDNFTEFVLRDDTYNSVSSILNKVNGITEENLKCELNKQNACPKGTKVIDLIPDQILSSLEQTITKYGPLLKTTYMILIRYISVYNNHCGTDMNKINRIIKLIRQIDTLTDFLAQVRGGQSCPTCPITTCPTCPTCQKCPPEKKCPDCPSCPPEKKCPDCQSCPSCPSCPDCPPEKKCPDCPEGTSKTPYIFIIATLCIIILVLGVMLTRK